MARLRTVAAAIATILALPASAAAAGAYARVLQSYERTGTIPACSFSSAELASALQGVDTYGEQYFADFTGAINAALAARAGGQCAAQAAQPPSGGAGLARLADQPLRIRSLTAGSASGVPLPIVLMALIACSIAIALAIGGVTRALAWDPAWLAGWRHAWGEAGYRAGGAWAGFVDWLRSAQRPT